MKCHNFWLAWDSNYTFFLVSKYSFAEAKQSENRVSKLQKNSFIILREQFTKHNYSNDITKNPFSILSIQDFYDDNMTGLQLMSKAYGIQLLNSYYEYLIHYLAVYSVLHYTEQFSMSLFSWLFCNLLHSCIYLLFYLFT